MNNQMQLVVVKQDAMGNPIVWQDQISKRLFSLDNAGNLTEIDQYGRPIQQQQQMMQQQAMPQYGQPMQQQNMYRQPMQQQGYGGAQVPQQNAFNIQLPQSNMDVTNPVVSRGYAARANEVPKQPVKQKRKSEQVVQVQQEPTVRSLEGYTPEPGSELVPLYDGKTEMLDIIIDESRKTYKIIVTKKES